MNVSRLAGRAAGAFCAAAAGLVVSTAQAQDIRMYAFSSGALTLGKGILQNLAPLEPPIQLPVGFYLIRHPKGNVLFDTGNNDKLITDPSYWPHRAQHGDEAGDDAGRRDRRPARSRSGWRRTTSTTSCCSHLHLDHGGNAAKFPNSTIVVQKDEVRERVLARARHRRSLRPRRLTAVARAYDDQANART